ncbi:MAG: hypothetical protein M3Y87_14205 [Myxococcota bacterium]|nr:hypothetical protein [Myxococcota bacterium]
MPAVEPAPPPPPSVAPLVTADVPIPETGAPLVVPALRRATRVGPGPWTDDLAIALGAGFIELGTGAEVEVLRELEHRRARYVLAAAPPRGAPVEHERALELRSIWLAQLESRVDPEEGVDVHRRVAAILLYDQALPSEPLDPAAGVITTPFTCAAETDLRARDLDGDGETELTAIVAFLRPTEEAWGGGGTPDECGAVAFLVGADDWNVQAAFTRDYAVQAFAAAIEVGERRETTWQLRDIDGDGRSDLRIIERWRYSNYFMGDYVGGGETEPETRETASDRRQLDCLRAPRHRERRDRRIVNARIA